MKIYLNSEYKTIRVEDNTFVANSNTNYVRYYFLDDAQQIVQNTNTDYVTLAFRRADGNTIQHFIASAVTTDGGEHYFEYPISLTDGVLYKAGALEVSAQFIKLILKSDGYNYRGAPTQGQAYHVNDYVRVTQTVLGQTYTYNYRCIADVASLVTPPAQDTTHWVDFDDEIVSRRVNANPINTAHVLDNIGEEAEQYYSQYETSNNEAHELLQTQITRNLDRLLLIGNLANLTTDAKTTVVAAINEVDGHADANKVDINNLKPRMTAAEGNISSLSSTLTATRNDIGTKSSLTTSTKTDLVSAINEVDGHADQALTNIGDRAQLTTTEKTNLVGAINEVDTNADNAQTKADSAYNLATSANTLAQTAKDIADGKSRSVGFNDISATVSALNGYTSTDLKTGDNVFIRTVGVPDLWVSSVAATSSTYSYTTDDAFVQDLLEHGTIQIGYYVVSELETLETAAPILWHNISVATTDWEDDSEDAFADYPYRAKVTLGDTVDFNTVANVVFTPADSQTGIFANVNMSTSRGIYIYAKDIPESAIVIKTILTFKPQVIGAIVGGQKNWSPMGLWASGTSYKLADTVYDSTGMYICIGATSGTTPPAQDATNWYPIYKTTTLSQNLVTGNIPAGDATWTSDVSIPIWEGSVSCRQSQVYPYDDTIVTKLPQRYTDGTLTTGWAVEIDGTRVDFGTLIADQKGYHSDLTQTYAISVRYNGEILIHHSQANPVVATKIWTASNSSSFWPKKCTIIDANITTTSDIEFNCWDDTDYRLRLHSLANGSITLIRDAVPDIAIQYNYKVQETHKTGQVSVNVKPYVKAEELVGTFDKIITTQADFSEFVVEAQGLWFDNISVAIMGQFTHTGAGIKLDGIKLLQGFNGAKITNTNITASGSAYELYYTTSAASSDMPKHDRALRDINIAVTGATGNESVTGVYKVANISNVTVSVGGEGFSNEAIGFRSCYNIVGCDAGANSTGNATAYDSCKYISLSNGAATLSPNGIGFNSCMSLNNCNALIMLCTGNGTGFKNCFMLANCLSGVTACVDSKAFQNIYGMSNCVGYATGTTSGYIYYGCHNVSSCDDGSMFDATPTTAVWGGTNSNVDMFSCPNAPGSLTINGTIYDVSISGTSLVLTARV